MRIVLCMGAAIVLAGTTPVWAQQSAPAAGASADPVTRLIGAVRERFEGMTGAPKPQAKRAVPTSRKGKRRAKRVRQPRRQQVRHAEAMPWPRPVRRAAGTAGAPTITMLRTSVVRRPIVEVVVIADELLPLPAVETIGIPVRLEVPTVGLVEVPEERYRQVFELLTSRDAAQQLQALSMLRELRDTTEALRLWARRRNGGQEDRRGRAPTLR
jgi:hypothetical protein